MLKNARPRFHAGQYQPTRMLRKCHLRKLYRRRRETGWTPKVASRRMEDWRIDGLNSVFPGFARWYRDNYDEDGRLLPTSRIPGLRPVHYLAEQARQEIARGEFEEGGFDCE